MTRKLRQELIAESNIYHITSRGAGRRLIFEDARDKANYLARLSRATEEGGVSVLAFCLMNNHVHLLLRGDLECITGVMHRLNTGHAQYFNGRHGHVGPVFQGRFDSAPVESDAHLMLAVRYIHHNPSDLGDDWAVYPWSSFPEYIAKPDTCDTGFVLNVFGGVEEFKRFHFSVEQLTEINLDGYRKRLSDAEALRACEARFGKGFSDGLSALPKEQRNARLIELRNLGLSVRQIERLTGVGRSSIARAVSEERTW